MLTSDIVGKLRCNAAGSKAGAAIHPQYLARLIDQHADEDAIFTADVGSPVIWAARYLSMTGKRRVLGSFNHGSMANALCHATTKPGPSAATEGLSCAPPRVSFTIRSGSSTPSALTTRATMS